MRNIFDAQYSIYTLRIEDLNINSKCRDALPKLLLALKELYINNEYSNLLFNILNNAILKKKQKTGRKGMNLWQIFVLAQVRLCQNISYDRLHYMVDNDTSLRQLLGIETDYRYERITFEYQNIIDNVKLLDDVTLLKINDLIVKFGHNVFKKKEADASCLKTDSYVVKNNVHYPTDYNLLWDSSRKALNTIDKILKKSDLKGWRKRKEWHRELKKLLRQITTSTRKSKENREKIAENYIKKARLLSKKLHLDLPNIEQDSLLNVSIVSELKYYIEMIDKHIDLFERRVLKGEDIPHSEKIFSIFEPYTEYICKGKQNPNFELGKNLVVTSDQFNLIVDFEILEKETDSQVVIRLKDRVLAKYSVSTWSFDKGFYSQINKENLQKDIPLVVMPKKGKLNKTEYDEEHQREFKKYRNKHSAVESNINELEHRGLDRCPDRTYQRFKNYVALGVCAYNLHKIGAELMKQKKEKMKLGLAA